MSEGHAKLSPSGAKKWMACPGSLAMEQGQPDDSSVYSDEGTAAHGLLAMCLTENSHPAGYIGRVLHVVNGVYTGDSDALGPEGAILRDFTVDADMAGHVNVTVQKVREYASGNEMFVEQRVPIDHITGEAGAAGTADVIIIADDGKELQVHDFKYGQGVQVFADHNPQGMMYLAGALREYEPLYGLPERCRFVIHQPRLNHLDEWDCSVAELMEFCGEAHQAAITATLALESFDNWKGKSTAYLTPGEHCKSNFCKARATCPALANFVQEAVGADFDEIKELDVARWADAATDLTALGRSNSVVDIILDWCKQVRARVEGALFENQNSEEAQAALGFKLVQGKKGNRAWKDGSEVEQLMKKTWRMKVEEIYDLSVKSPTVITKALKDNPKRLAKLAPLIVQRDGVPSVAALSDKRPALCLTPTGGDFEVVEDGSEFV